MSELSKSETDVLVVGAGPTGLTMAAELAARGVGCRIIDKAPARSQHTRALVVQARSLELMQKMGIADELVARGRRTLKVTPFVGGRRAADVEFGDIGVDDTPYPFLLFVSQAET
jgi:2-polyprenyl-6-methoxyphenol hydroxylase-like FAD-dependent oxidoreductase